MSQSSDNKQASALNADAHQAALAFAERLADEAASITLPYFRSGLSTDNKASGNAFDPVTKADKDAEEAIRALIQEQRPEDGILGEEFGPKASRNGFTWVLDPIDGTRSFITGVPLWGTMIALNHNGRPFLSVIDQPFTGERFIGSLLGNNKTTSLKHKDKETPCRTRPCKDIKEAILTCTTPDMFSAREKEAYLGIEKTVRLTRYSMDCYGYCLLALGSLDVVIESDLAAYDVQALIPIVEGAGGIITNWKGEDPSKGGQVIAAGDPRVHEQCLKLLQKAAN